MLELNFIRQNPELVKDRLRIRNFHNIASVDELIITDELRRKKQTIGENISAEINTKSKEIGTLIQNKNNKIAEKVKHQVNLLKNELTLLNKDLEELEKKQLDLLLSLPNIPNEKVIGGKSAEDNIIEKTSEIKNLHNKDLVPHWDLCKKYDIVNFELGTKITGTGFPFYINKGARLLRALINYFLDYNIKAGYKEYISPLMVNQHAAFGTGQLPDKEGQMYFINEDNLYLIPTAEVTLTNIYNDEIINANDLPIKLTGHTQCFRREAGSYGKDVRGLNRLHQFDKVEIVQIVEAQNSYKVLDEMVLHVENLVKSLELPYRILRLCGGDMGFTSALTYDFEVYSIAQQRWLEVSSVSNFETFQTNRMKIRTKNQNGKTTLLHSLNGSSLALPRIMATLIENNQTESSIKIPKVLQPYFGQSEIT